MDRVEFIKRLKEDKFFSEPQEMIDYRLPVVQYHLTVHMNSNIMIIYDNNTDFKLVNQAFESIKKKYKDRGII